MIHSVVPCTPEHLFALAANLRAGDAAEIEAGGITPSRALWRSYRTSVIARAGLIDGEVAACWGCGGSPLGRAGQPWLLTGPACERARVTFVRVARFETARMLHLFPELRGMVDARYDRAIRLLEGLGFSIGAARPWGPRGAMFREYVLMRRAQEAARWAA